jgi:hypothetical protein
MKFFKKRGVFWETSELTFAEHLYHPPTLPIITTVAPKNLPMETEESSSTKPTLWGQTPNF